MSLYLLDTHILLWWLINSEKLSQKHLLLINNPDNLILVSTASIWEIVLKQATGKLNIPEDLSFILDDNNIEILDITMEHALQVKNLPLWHNDPLDRILIAQCMTENLTLITVDKLISKYDIKSI